MKVLSEPSSGACGDYVAYIGRYGQVRRARIVPKNTKTPARDFMHTVFGYHSQAYSHKLTEEQQNRWIAAAGQVMSDPRFGYGALTGQQFYERIQCVLSRVGAPELPDPPAKVVFGPNPTGPLTITNDESGVRLFVEITGDLDTDIMVFGQAPCSPGRHKRRNVSYLGLLPPPIAGKSEVTYLYRARFGEPRPGTKVFIVTCQQKNGWKGHDQVTNARVPEPPKPQTALLQPCSSQFLHMHKGSSSAADGQVAPHPSHTQGATKPNTGGGKAGEVPLEGGGGAGGGDDSP
jgi:hypothetical protein